MADRGEVQDEVALRELGRRLGARATPGCVAALQGTLGAGKTTLAQAIAGGLGVAGPVVSPTFGLMHLYEDGRIPLVHADLYRLEAPEEADALGLEEALEEPVVGLVEWSERAPGVLPRDHLVLRIEIVAGGRRVFAEATGPRSAAWWASVDHG